jgi:membrane fusion protein (multidrug efflux system)
MDKKKKILAGIGSVAAVGGIYLMVEHFMYVSTDNAQIEAHSMMIAPKVSGYVITVNVTEGQKVKKGDILAEIDARDFENALTQAKGELTSMEARRKDADRNFQRLNDLFKSGAVSRAQFDTATASYSETRAKYDAAAAQVAQAQLNLDNSRLRAPYDGWIARKSVEVGQLAGAGVPLIGFVDSNERWVMANFKETDIPHVKVGSHASIEVDAVPGKTFQAKVEAISPSTGATFTLLPPDNATGNFTKVVQRVPVKLSLENLTDADKESLRAGLSATATVDRK